MAEPEPPRIEARMVDLEESLLRQLDSALEHRQQELGRALTQTEVASGAGVEPSFVSKVYKRRQRRAHEPKVVALSKFLASLELPLEQQPRPEPPRIDEAAADSIRMIEEMRTRDLHSSDQRSALEALRHLLVGRQGTRISNVELAGALILISNEGLETELESVLLALGSR